MTKSTGLIRNIKTGAMRLLPMIFAASGFCAGVIIRLFTPGGAPGLPAPDMTSAFLSPHPFAAVVDCLSGEFKYALLIYLLGFCAFGNIAPSAVLAFRAALAGYSAAYMLEGHYGLAIYFTHTVMSIGALMAFCCLVRVSSDQAESFVHGGGEKRGRSAISYTARCLFYTGMIFAAVLLRQLLLAFIHV